MAPAARVVQNYEANEKVLCYHGPVMYDAKILDVQHKEPDNKKSPFQYFVHYLGWKGSWDDWVEDDRLRKANPENQEVKRQQHAAQKNQQRAEVEAKRRKTMAAAAPAPGKRKSGALPDLSSSVRNSEERGGSAAPPRGTKRGRDWEMEKEQDFLNKPAVKIPLPDSIKRLLVDDWEFVTKDQTLVPLPHPHPVSQILADYSAYQAPKRRAGSAESDVLDEVVQGVREYFDKSLGRILLYRFERPQWLDLVAAMNKDPGSAAAARTVTMPAADGAAPSSFTRNIGGKTAADVYGPEHLARLFVSMPELIAQTNMDKQSVARLGHELALLTKWLAAQAPAYFAAGYVDPGDEYKAKARSNM